MRKICWSDLETFSPIPLKNGTHVYAEKAEILLWAFAINDGPPVVWDVASREPIPFALQQALDDPECVFTWHNAGFDMTVLKHVGYDLPIERARCTMVRALAHALPGSLDKLGELLGIPEELRKLKEGRDPMRLFCMPRPKNQKLRRATKETHPAEWALFVRYAANDILAMREIARRLPTWNMAADYPVPGEEWQPKHTELSHWHRDQRMNARGFAVDLALTRAALRAVDKAQAVLRTQCLEATDGAVASATQRDKLLEFLLAEYDISLPDMRGSTLEKILTDPAIDDGLRELLRIRLAATTSSTAKYKSLANGVSSDERLRGTIQMNGAGRTRRAAGRTFQPHNLPRPDMENPEIELGIRALKADAEVMLFGDDVMRLCSNAIRGCIIAPPGKKTVVADLSNIEGRVLAWMAKEEWLLQYFRDFDAGLAHDLYKVEYTKAFGGDPSSVTKPQRQLGKVLTLFGGYQGSIGAFVTFSAVYGIDLDAMAQNALPLLSEDAIRHAEDLLAWFKEKKIRVPPLPHRTLIAILCLVYGWRADHPATVKLWKGLEETAIEATLTPGETFTFGRFQFRRDGAWLRCLMPSGRCIVYPHPQVNAKGKLSYMGMCQYTKQWKRIFTYGGKITENICQSLSRDILYDAQGPAEAAGYELILHVHDENITEVPDEPRYCAEDLSRIMTRPPSWRPDGSQSYAPDLPLAAAGFESTRYKKD